MLGPDRSVERAAKAQIPTRYGKAVMYGYRGIQDRGEHLALVFGSPERERAPLVRIHSECFTCDVFGSLRCDCGLQLDAALRQIAGYGTGVVVYLRQEGRGIGLLNKLRAYALQENGLDTVDANRALGFADDLRDYRIGADMLADLGIGTVRLLSNNPDKIRGLEQWGIRVVERKPLVIAPVVENVAYTDGPFVETRRTKYTQANAHLRTFYEKLKSEGDRNVYYVPAPPLLGDDAEGTVDGTHPTDLGFLRMAETVGTALQPLVGR